MEFVMKYDALGAGVMTPLGWSGRWLVNGAGDGLVVIDIDPPARARVTGVPVRVRELTVSMEDADPLVAELQRS